jgi:hypothetical protein
LSYPADQFHETESVGSAKKSKPNMPKEKKEEKSAKVRMPE